MIPRSARRPASGAGRLTRAVSLLVRVWGLWGLLLAVLPLGGRAEVAAPRPGDGPAASPPPLVTDPARGAPSGGAGSIFGGPPALPPSGSVLAAPMGRRVDQEQLRADEGPMGARAVAVPSTATPAEISSLYQEPTHANLTRTFIALGGVEEIDDDVLDEYAQLTQCAIFRHWFPDDLRWLEVRRRLAQVIQQDRAPRHYRVDAGVIVDRYDEARGGFAIADPYRRRNLGILGLQRGNPPRCERQTPYLSFPERYLFRALNPIDLDLLPVAPEDAKPLVRRMLERGHRAVYLRFAVDLTGVRQIRLVGDRIDEVVFNGHVRAVEFYEDEARTQRIAIVGFEPPAAVPVSVIDR